MKTVRSLCLSLLALGPLALAPAVAGPLDPPVLPPAPTPAALQQIYDAVKPPGCFNNNPTGLRFVDCGNGTVQDIQSGLIWLKNANCLPLGTGLDWATANRRAAKLADGTSDGTACGLSDGSKAGTWRLPTDLEWGAVLNAGCATFPKIRDAAGTGCYSTGPWATGVATTQYWSSTPFASNLGMAWIGHTGQGGVTVVTKPSSQIVWPVRAGP